MINQAIAFATQCHINQTRKGSDIPYILHCIEAGLIASNMTKKNNKVNQEVVAAAILHDTIEDANATYKMIEQLFGEKVANLVQSQSEDKSKSWQERKEATIEFLKNNKSKEVEIATLADKLSNIRSISSDQELLGEDVWKKFNSPKEKQHWYYQSIADVLTQIQDTLEHKEYVELVKKIFD